MTGAEQAVRRCRELGSVSEEPGRLTRPFASPAMARANALVGGWMAEAGLAVHVDAAGNLVGRRPGTGERAGVLLLGSHLDTVRGAGVFDGPLGVMVALAALQRCPPLGFDVEVLGFSDEEGLRYGTAYLGSRAVAGTFDAALLALADADGITLGDALRGFGGDPDGIAALARRDVLGWCEVHIEQGPVLDDAGLPVGVVSAIAGATRAEVRFVGRSGHAGTVPMAGRRDALAAAAEWILDVEAAGRDTPGLVATVGRLLAEPGATNVIAGAAVASLDVRHAEDGVRTGAVERLQAQAQACADARGLALTWTTLLENPATTMDPRLTALLAEAAAGAGPPVSERGAAAGPDVPLLASGAGHDAVALAALTGVAMLFVRCAGGVSHHPDESVRPQDVAVAIETLAGFLVRLG